MAISFNRHVDNLSYHNDEYGFIVEENNITIDTYDIADADKLRRWITKVITDNHCRVGNIGYLFTSDKFVHEANVKYLGHDTLTDIITFDYVEGNIISGDIMISVSRVYENAHQMKIAFQDELHRVIIHGILHLLGQGDKTPDEEQEMRRREDEALHLWQTME